MILEVEIFIIVLSVLVMSALALIMYFHVMVKLGVRKRKLSQIRQVSELMNEKLGHSNYDNCFSYDCPDSFLLSPFTMINIL